MLGLRPSRIAIQPAPNCEQLAQSGRGRTITERSAKMLLYEAGVTHRMVSRVA
jgi:hypothetical protein